MQESNQMPPAVRAMRVVPDTGEYDVETSLAELRELARTPAPKRPLC
jgi:hypothetical protein